VERLKVNEWQYLVLPLFQTKSETVLQKLREAVDMVRPLLLRQFFLVLVNKKGADLFASAEVLRHMFHI